MKVVSKAVEESNLVTYKNLTESSTSTKSNKGKVQRKPSKLSLVVTDSTNEKQDDISFRVRNKFNDDTDVTEFTSSKMFYVDRIQVFTPRQLYLVTELLDKYKVSYFWGNYFKVVITEVGDDETDYKLQGVINGVLDSKLSFNIINDINDRATNYKWIKENI